MTFLQLVKTNSPKASDIWKELVRETGEIKEASDLIKEAKELGSGHVAIYSHQADKMVIAASLRGDTHIVDPRDMNMARHIEMVIDMAAVLEKDVSSEVPIVRKALERAIDTILKNKSEYAPHVIGLARTTKIWSSLKELVGCHDALSCGKALKNLSSHLNERGKAKIGRHIVNQTIGKYPAKISELTAPPVATFVSRAA